MDAIANHQVWNALAVTGTNTYRGGKSSMKLLGKGSYQFLWTGTPTGTLTIQVSNKPTPDDATDTDWTTLTLAVAITQPAGAAGSEFVGLDGLEALWVRPRYVNASGSGAVVAWFTGKGF